MPFHKIDGPVFAWHGPGGTVDPGWGVGSPEGPDNDLPWGPGRPDNSLPWGPGRPGNSLPPLPGIWPPPGKPSLPVVLPPLYPTQPIYIEGAPPATPGGPSTPIALPPGIYPPLPPDAALPTGKIAILIWIVGVGYRWLVYDKVAVAPPITGAQPK